MPAQDLEEPFDVCDEEGRPTGERKARRLVHADGDWHRSVHVWVILRTEGDVPRLLLQRRSLEKDTWPGALDVAVGGHLRAGETVEDALREAEEELGVAIAPDDAIPIGRRWREDRSRPGTIDREIQAIFCATIDGPLARLAPDPDEVSELVAIDLADALRFARGATVPALALANGQARAIDVQPSELLRSRDGYVERALEATLAIERGDQPRPFEIRPPVAGGTFTKSESSR